MPARGVPLFVVANDVVDAGEHDCRIKKKTKMKMKMNRKVLLLLKHIDYL